ncbi:MAG: beta-ketoacyl synthase [Gammaproteobacteria bacterium]|nr:beta-ketoacyl synthase [Gammaproteobacteria bacterium]
MNRLPVMIGFGGINPAGRVSFDHAYRRLVIDKLELSKQDSTYESLAALMRLNKLQNSDLSASTQAGRQHIRDHTLIRRIELYDPDRVAWQSSAELKGVENNQLTFVLPKRQLPESIPPSWQVSDINEREVRVVCSDSMRVLFPEQRPAKVTSAGQLPSGFDPGALYASRNHPRGLQLAVYGASDAIQSTGFSVDELKTMVRPDQMAVYSGSAMGQLDNEAYSGLLQNPMVGRRPTAKNCALGLPEMPGDFVNAYVLGSVGETAGIIGACATFLYNVKRGLDEIRSGEKRIVIVGNSEAPIVPHVVEGYRVMGALAEDDELKALDGSELCDNRRACRPFSSNAGFTVAEASIWLVLMDDELAIAQGARVLGSVGAVFVNADGYKKSISGPGIGNYVTAGKAMAAARAILGEKTLRQNTYMQAHGTGTPQNRVTESHIFNELAKTFGINSWLVGAVKCYLGHSMAPAGGDQLSAILGAWADGWVPGISTIDHIAADVHNSNLNFPMQHVQIDPTAMRGAFVNSKGFGGNNATGLFLSPHQTMEMLTSRWGKQAMTAHRRAHEPIAEQARTYNTGVDIGEFPPIYEFGKGVLAGSDLKLEVDQIVIPGFANPIDLKLKNPYTDMMG